MTINGGKNGGGRGAYAVKLKERRAAARTGGTLKADARQIAEAAQKNKIMWKVIQLKTEGRTQEQLTETVKTALEGVADVYGVQKLKDIAREDRLGYDRVKGLKDQGKIIDRMTTRAVNRATQG